MTLENGNTNYEIRLAAIEIRMAAVESLLQNLAGASTEASKTAKKRAEAEKAKVKAELLKNAPYDKKRIEELSSSKLKMLASAMGIKSFGLKRDDIAKAVLAKQKKRGKMGFSVRRIEKAKNYAALEEIHEDYHTGDCIILKPSDGVEIIGEDLRYLVIDFVDHLILVYPKSFR